MWKKNFSCPKGFRYYIKGEYRNIKTFTIFKAKLILWKL